MSPKKDVNMPIVGVVFLFFAWTIGCSDDMIATYPADTEADTVCYVDDDCTDSGRFPGLTCVEGICKEVD